MDKKIQKENKTSAIYNIFGWLIVIILLLGILYIVYMVVKYGFLLLKELSKLDAVIIVALISGAISFMCLMFGKILEYQNSRKEYLAQKREDSYAAFIDMVYKLIDGSKGSQETTSDISKDISNFSKELTLWGSPIVAKKYNEFKKNSLAPKKDNSSLWLLEEIINQMRYDLGVKKTKKGQLLGFFINDIDDVQ